MANDNEGTFAAYLSGFLLGGIVGAAVALLLAPQSGEETRSIINVKAIELKDQIDTVAADAKTKADELTQDAREKAVALQQQGQEIIVEQKSRIEQAVEAGKDAMKAKASKKTDDAAAEA